jgi:hypothetical protein
MEPLVVYSIFIGVIEMFSAGDDYGELLFILQDK